jgi:hypothetical protein
VLKESGRCRKAVDTKQECTGKDKRWRKSKRVRIGDVGDFFSKVKYKTRAMMKKSE